MPIDNATCYVNFRGRSLRSDWMPIYIPAKSQTEVSEEWLDAYLHTSLMLGRGL